MSSKQLPDFEQAQASVERELEAFELSECHGICCALLCRLSGVNPDHYLGLLSTLEVVKAPGADLQLLLENLFDVTRNQFRDEELGMDLWLPADHETLEDRTMALCSWCSGFLAGLGAGGEDSLKGLSDDANEAIRDIRHISSADVTDTTESEEVENAFTEIVEYLRVVVLLISEELRGPDPQDTMH